MLTVNELPTVQQEEMRASFAGQKRSSVGSSDNEATAFAVMPHYGSFAGSLRPTCSSPTGCSSRVPQRWATVSDVRLVDLPKGDAASLLRNVEVADPFERRQVVGFN